MSLGGTADCFSCGVDEAIAPPVVRGVAAASLPSVERMEAWAVLQNNG